MSRPKIHEILTKGYGDLDEKEKAQLLEVLEMDNSTIEEKAPAPWYRQFLLWDPIPYLKRSDARFWPRTGTRTSLWFTPKT